ncbi:NmrA domain-containing protein [Favolaschia claudopus]|uniref:NmrA domain-containing protein n=1 Tax=Favolaschia claudopus TaxID=2862362 RepID=A0AAW0C0T7_9AGAR
MSKYYKSVAIVGGGAIGLPIVNALAAKDVPLILLSRPGSSKKTVPSNVQVVEVDFYDAAAVSKILKEHKVDVVLSTVGPTAVAAEWPLVAAAKLAGVKLYLPSKYGFPGEGFTDGVLGAKNQVVEYLKMIQLPSICIHTGLFTEYIPWLVSYDGPGSNFKLARKGEAPVSFTAIADIAGFLENRVIRLEGGRSSLKDLAGLFGTSIEYVDDLTGEASQNKMLLQSLMETGAGSSGWDGLNKTEGTGNKAAGADNALWPGHKWQSIQDVHKL